MQSVCRDTLGCVESVLGAVVHLREQVFSLGLVLVHFLLDLVVDLAHEVAEPVPLVRDLRHNQGSACHFLSHRQILLDDVLSNGQIFLDYGNNAVEVFAGDVLDVVEVFLKAVAHVADASLDVVAPAFEHVAQVEPFVARSCLRKNNGINLGLDPILADCRGDCVQVIVVEIVIVVVFIVVIIIVLVLLGKELVLGLV